MRIRIGEFKQIVREEAHRMRRKSKRLDEIDMDDQGDMENLLIQVLDAWGGQMLSAYDEHDPSMAALGEEAWEEQVMAAVEELSVAVQAALDDVEARLVGGEFYTHRRDPRAGGR